MSNGFKFVHNILKMHSMISQYHNGEKNKVNQKPAADTLCAYAL